MNGRPGRNFHSPLDLKLGVIERDVTYPFNHRPLLKIRRSYTVMNSGPYIVLNQTDIKPYLDV